MKVRKGIVTTLKLESDSYHEGAHENDYLFEWKDIIKAHFVKYDTDRDGSISKVEFRSLLGDFNIYMPRGEASKMTSKLTILA